MDDQHQQFVVVGAGQAGARAAFAIREAGSKARIVMVGDEGLAPYERPPLSKEVLVQEDQPPPVVLPSSWYNENGIEVIWNDGAERIDRDAQRLALKSGRKVPYDQLLLATGGRPRRLNIPGGEAISYLRTYADAQNLRGRLRSAKRVCCLGAGVIGLEVAASARSLSCEALVIEAAAGVAQRCMPEAEASFLQELHKHNGVDIRTGTTVKEVRQQRDSTLELVLSDGSLSVVDCLVAGLGIVRNIELAAEAGLDVSAGIIVNEFGQTSDPRIFAAGDVASFWHPVFQEWMMLESWYHAQNHGIHVGRAMCGILAPYLDTPRFWTDQFGLNVQVAGFPTRGDRHVLRGKREEGKFTSYYLDQDNRLVGIIAANDARAFRPALQLMEKGEPVDPEQLGAPVGTRQLKKNAAPTSS